MKVLQILQRKGSNEVESVTAQTSIADTAARLSEKRIGCMLVLADNGKLDGVVSERDIVRALGEAGDACLDDTVATIMTSDVITCSPEDTDDQVLDKMTSGRFRHLPVFQNDELKGLISIGDVVKARIESLKSENEELENMIRSATA